MIDKNQFASVINVLNKMILGTEEKPKQNEKRHEFIEIDTEEEFDVERSIN